MKRIFVFYILLAVSLIACTTGKKIVATNELRAVFDQYVAAPHESDNERSSYFTENMWKVLQESRGNLTDKNDVSVSAINTFPNEIVVERSMESINDGKGCLIVQGADRGGSHIDYNIELIRLNNRWVFSDISVTLYDPGQKRWLTEPICDTEKRQLFWLNSQHQE